MSPKATLRASIAGLVLLLAACTAPAQASGPPAVVVRVADAHAEPTRTSTAYLAELRARASVTLQPRVNGYVRAIAVEPGDRVAAGTALIELDAQQEEADLATLEAAQATASAQVGIASAQLRQLEQDVARARAEEQLARKQHERLAGLLPRGAVTIDEVDEAERNVAVTKAAVAAAARALDAQRATITSSKRAVVQQHSSALRQKVALDYFTVRAPFDGIVGDIPVRLGELVGPTTALTTVDRAELIDAMIRVPADRGPELRVGLPVEIVDREGKVLQRSSIAFVSPRVDEATQTVLVEAELSAAAGALRTGQLVRARIVWDERERVRVPLTAVRRVNGKTFVFVAEHDPEKGLVARQRLLELGPLGDRTYPVLEGLEDGERVVIAGAQKLRDGARIELEEAAS